MITSTPFEIPENRGSSLQSRLPRSNASLDRDRCVFGQSIVCRQRASKPAFKTRLDPAFYWPLFQRGANIAGEAGVRGSGSGISFQRSPKEQQLGRERKKGGRQWKLEGFRKNRNVLQRTLVFRKKISDEWARGAGCGVTLFEYQKRRN